MLISCCIQSFILILIEPSLMDNKIDLKDQSILKPNTKILKYITKLIKKLRECIPKLHDNSCIQNNLITFTIKNKIKIS